MGRRVVLDLSAVIIAVTGGAPRVLTVRHDGLSRLPAGAFDPDADQTLDRAMRRWVTEETGLRVGFLEQLYTFADQHRDPDAEARGERPVTVAYVAFVRESALGVPERAEWRDIYEFMPWEDGRSGRPSLLREAVEPALARWADAEEARRERAEVTFGLAGALWDPVRVLERFELLYEAGMAERLGRPTHLDHRRILASALGRVRGKLTYRPVVFELLPPTFTLSELQESVEALIGAPLHKQNFRRLVEAGGLVEGTGQRRTGTGGRPAELFRFRRDVLRERPAPGLSLPGRR